MSDGERPDDTSDGEGPVKDVGPGGAGGAGGDDGWNGGAGGAGDDDDVVAVPTEGKEDDFEDEGKWEHGGEDGGGGRDDEESESEDEDADLEDLPIFANDENRELHQQVKAKERELETVEDGLKDNSERLKVMREHLRNVQQELQHTQQLVDAKTREVDTEKHLYQISSREVGRIEQEMRRVDDEREKVQDQLNVVQNGIFKGNERMGRFQMQMNWNKEELEQWALAAKQKEEDAMALEKYTRADEAKIKDLNLQIEKLTSLTHERRLNLEQEVTETQAKQIELDKAAEEFRQIHKERQELVNQWQEAIETMRRRDEEIQRAGERYARAVEETRARRAAMKEHARRLEQAQQDNMAVEGQIAVRDREVSALRQRQNRAAEALREFEDEVEVLKSELNKAATTMMQQRSSIRGAKGEMEEKTQRLESSRARYKRVKQQLETEKDAKGDVEKEAQSAEDYVKSKESELAAAQKELTALKEKSFRKSQELFKLRQEEASFIAQISGSQAASKNLSSKIHKLDEQSLRQQELIYNSEFEIQQLERKVARASGERSDEENKALNAKIEELSAQLDRANGEHAMLQQQSKKLAEEHRAARRRLQELESERKKVEEAIGELKLEISSADQSLGKAETEKEELLVEHDVLKLQVKRLREALSQRSDAVFGLENRTHQLKLSMEERRKEVQVYLDTQKAQLKTADAERHKVAMELREREQKVEKLKAKYETLVKGGKDEEGEERSQAYFVIKAAQKREELQREGDDLDAKIRKTEKELRALRKTLDHLTDRNTRYRKNVTKADTSSQDAKKLRQLEERCRLASDDLFKKRKDLQRLHTDLDEDKRRLEQLRAQRQRLDDEIQELQASREQVAREVAEQQDKLQRATETVEAKRNEHREMHGSGGETHEERAMRAQSVHETNQNVLYTLGELAREFPEIQESLRTALRERGLRVPARPPSRMSSRPPSAQSDASRRSEAPMAVQNLDLGL